MIKVAIVGAGGMAGAHARAFNSNPDCRLVAACDIDPLTLKEFCDTNDIAGQYTDFSRMLQCEDIDAISNVTPDAFHKSISLQALAAGKNVLCEKPLAENYPDAQEMADAAAASGLINMVNFTYRNKPAYQHAAALVQSGKLGDVRHVEASYRQSWLSSKYWGDWKTSPRWLWRLSEAHGSNGVLGDVGVHIIDFASWPVGDIASIHCRLKTFDKAAGGKIGEYILDANDSAIMSVEFENGAVGTIQATRWATGHRNSLSLLICGTKGAVRVDLDKSEHSIDVCLGEDVDEVEWKTIDSPSSPDNWQRFIQSIKSGQNDQPDFARGAAIQKVLNACEVSDGEGKTIEI